MHFLCNQPSIKVLHLSCRGLNRENVSHTNTVSAHMELKLILETSGLFVYEELHLHNYDWTHSLIFAVEFFQLVRYPVSVPYRRRYCQVLDKRPPYLPAASGNIRHGQPHPETRSGNPSFSTPECSIGTYQASKAPEIPI